MPPKNLSMNSGPVVGSKPRRGPGFQNNDSAPADTRHNYQGEMFQAGPNQTADEIQKSIMQSTETKLHNRGVYKNASDANRAATRTNQSYVQAMMEAQQAFTKAQKMSEDFDTMAFQTNKNADEIQNVSARESELFDGRDKKQQKITKTGFDESQVVAGNEGVKKALKNNTILETPDANVLNAPLEEEAIQMTNGINAFTETKTEDNFVSNESPETTSIVPVDTTDEEHKKRLKYVIGRISSVSNEIQSQDPIKEIYDEKVHFSPESSCRICVSSTNSKSKLGEYLSQNKNDIIAIMGDTIGLSDDSDPSHKICVNGIGNTAEIMVQGFDLSSVKDKYNESESDVLKNALMYAIKDKLNDYGDANATIHDNTGHLVNISDFKAGISNEMIFDKPIIKFGEPIKEQESNHPLEEPSQKLDESLVSDNSRELYEDQPVF